MPVNRNFLPGINQMSKHQKKYGPTTGLHIKPWMAGLLVFLLLAAFSLYIIYLRYNMLKNDEKQAAMNMAESVRYRLQQSLQYSLAATQAMALTIDKDGIPRNFDSVASFILKNNKYIDGLELVPDGIIRYVYPLKENAAAIGYNIFEDSLRSKEAFKAVEKKELFFAGPFELRQGGMAVVGRLPLYMNDKFWGFSAVIIHMPTLLEAAGIDTTGKTGYYFQLSKINPDTKKEEFFLPVKDGSSDYPEVVISIPTGEWKLAVNPVSGYKSLQGIIPISILAAVLSIMGGIFATYASKTPARLQNLVMEKTRELKKSEQRNKNIVNALPDMVFVIDREGRYIDFHNPLLHQNAVSSDQIISKNVSDILPGPLAAEVMTYLNKVLQTGEITSHSYEMEVDGEVRSYESRYVPHRKDDVLVLVRDTTQAKKAEQQIKESEAKYRTLVEQATDAIFIAGFEGNFIVVNPAACKLSQYTEEELMKMRVHDLTAAGELKAMPFKMENIASGKTTTSERTLLRKNGELIDVEITAKIIAPDRFLAFVRDITERKKAEAEIKKSNERFNLVAFATNDVIWDWDLVNGNMWWNENFYTLFLLEKEKVKKDINSWYEGLHPDDLERAKKSLHTAIETRENTWSEEYRFLKSNGEIVEIFDRGYLIYNADGSPYRMIGSMLDITERKKADQEILRSREDLRKLSNHIENIREEERLNVAREIHDELGQQLTVLKMDVSRIGKKITIKEEKLLPDINEILASINKMVETVRKISAELRPGLLDDLGLVAALEWYSQDFSKRTGIKTSFISGITDDQFPQQLNIGLFRIFQESLTNIARHAEAREADVSLIWQDHQLVLLIEDDGKGFDPHIINDKKTLGFIGMKERAKMIGGSYNVYSAPGKGTIIEVVVPFKMPESQQMP
jgi:PAS domain S-box-containing protein